MVKTSPQRDEGLWIEGLWERDAAKPPVAQRAGGIFLIPTDPDPFRAENAFFHIF